MLIGNIINDSFGLISKQLRFYCWHFRRSLDQKQRRELIELLYEQHFERLASKIRSLSQNQVSDGRQQVGKLLFEHCLTRNRRHQLIQLIESKLVDINVRLDNYGRTLLHRAAYNLDVELLKILIEHGVNIRLRDYAGNTALHIAIQSYRNGSVIYGNGPDVVQNLTSIIRLLLEADRELQSERNRRKKLKTLTGERSLMPLRRSSEPIMASLSHNRHPLIIFDELSSDQAYPYLQSRSELHGNLVVRSHTSSSMTGLKEKPLIQRDNRQSIHKDGHIISQQASFSTSSTSTINPILLEDVSSPLIDTKNAFGRTALHYCVLVVGEQHLAHFVQLLISFGADTDATDTRMKTPLYCLVKRPNVSAVRQKCQAITHLLESGCDNLGLAIEPRSYFNEQFIAQVEENLSTIMQSNSDFQSEQIFTHSTFKRVPQLKHIVRLRLIRIQDERNRLRRQVKLTLPPSAPYSLNLYINRRILDQTELF